VFPVRYELYILPTQCICVFRMVLTTNRDHFPKQHQPAGLCNGVSLRFLSGANQTFKCNLVDSGAGIAQSV
jgi:hypothetical protein